MIKTTLFFALAFKSISGIAQCAPQAANVYSFTFSGVTYEIIKENLNWTDAAACAVSRGGMLTEINSQAEQDAIFTNVNLAGITAASIVAPDGGGASYLWLGGNDLAIEGNWVWNGNNDGSSVQFWQGTASGSAIGGLFSNWGNEPDNWNNQDCLGLAFTNWPLGVAGQWNDLAPTNQLYFIIEYPLNSIESEEQSNGIVYPNPINNASEINLKNIQIGAKISLTNSSGQQLLNHQCIENEFAIDVSMLQNGLYFLSIYNDENKIISTKKIIIQ